MKKVFFIIFLQIFTLLSINITYADSDIHRIDNLEQGCMTMTYGNTSKMNECSFEAQKAWEQEISNSLIELKRILEPQDYKILLESQKAWVNYKQKMFDLAGLFPKYKSGTMYQNVKQGWQTNIIKQRALDLEEYINTLNFQ